jgi:hypothetical protein
MAIALAVSRIFCEFTQVNPFACAYLDEKSLLNSKGKTQCHADETQPL